MLSQDGEARLPRRCSGAGPSPRVPFASSGRGIRDDTSWRLGLLHYMNMTRNPEAVRQPRSQAAALRPALIKKLLPHRRGETAMQFTRC